MRNSKSGHNKKPKIKGRHEMRSKDIFVQQSPLFIPETLCQIFEYLNVRSLKNCRLVCKTWNIHAPNELAKRKRKSIQLDTETDLYDFIRDFIGKDGEAKGATNLISKISLHFELPIDEFVFFKLIPKEVEIHKLVLIILSTLGKFFKHFRLSTKEDMSFETFSSLILSNTPNLTCLKLQSAKITKLDSVNKDSIVELKHLKKITLPGLKRPAHSIEAYYDVWTSICPNVESFGCDDWDEKCSSFLHQTLVEKNMIQKLTEIPRPFSRNNKYLLGLKKYQGLSLLWKKLNLYDYNDVLSFNEGTLKKLEISETRSAFGIFNLPVLNSVLELKLEVSYRFIKDLSFAASFPNLKIVKFSMDKEFNFDPIYFALHEFPPLPTVTELEIRESGIHANMNIFAFSRVRFPNMKTFKLFSNGILLFREVQALWRSWKNTLEELSIEVSPVTSGGKRKDNYELTEDYENFFDVPLTGYDIPDLKTLNRKVCRTGNFTEPLGTKYTYPSTYFPLTIRNMTKLRKLTLKGIKGFEFPFISFKTIANCNSLEEITIETLSNNKIPKKALNILKTSIRDMYYV